MGHVLHYETLTQKEARIAYCTIFASNSIGLENISIEGREMMVFYETKASEYALNLLKDMSDDKTFIQHARNTYNQWIEGYFKKSGLSTTDNPINNLSL